VEFDENGFLPFLFVSFLIIHLFLVMNKACGMRVKEYSELCLSKEAQNGEG